MATPPTLTPTTRQHLRPLVKQPPLPPPAPLVLPSPAELPHRMLSEPAHPHARTDERLAALEVGVKSILATQQELMEAVKRVQHELQQRPATVAAAEIQQTSQAAQQRLERGIAATHAQFARYDSDTNGVLDVAELTRALNALGSLRGGRKLTEEDAARVLEGYDKDGNGGLDTEEVHALFAMPSARSEAERDPPVLNSLTAMAQSGWC